ncbi:MAG: helix-turn-helix transcriptional regulator [Chloroflexi bacterium]|nr:helix-turn-helix transcriptional regulator [Chloroflexota bacterium]
MVGDLLSERELEVALLAVCGLTDLEIALRLGVSASTVHNTMSAVYRKTGAGSRPQLALMMVADGTITPREAGQLLVLSGVMSRRSA